MRNEAQMDLAKAAHELRKAGIAEADLESASVAALKLATA
jgi:hypothetical protein